MRATQSFCPQPHHRPSPGPETEQRTPPYGEGPSATDKESDVSTTSRNTRSGGDWARRRRSGVQPVTVGAKAGWNRRARLHDQADKGRSEGQITEGGHVQI